MSKVVCAGEVPLGRLVDAQEVAEFAYLCSEAADCFVGQVFPMCRGWVGEPVLNIVFEALHVKERHQASACASRR